MITDNNLPLLVCWNSFKVTNIPIKIVLILGQQTSVEPSLGGTVYESIINILYY